MGFSEKTGDFRVTSLLPLTVISILSEDPINFDLFNSCSRGSFNTLYSYGSNSASTLSDKTDFFESF